MTLQRYLVYGFDVESELALTTVPLLDSDGLASDETRPRMHLRLGTADFFAARTSGVTFLDNDWIQQIVLPDGGIYVWVKDVLQTIVSPDGRTATCRWMDGADRRAFEANLLNFALSAALTLLGEEPLHATVVALGPGPAQGRTVGLMGPSGTGKSTLAACLIGQGGDLVTDDMLRLELGPAGAVAHPGPYRLKLLPDTARRLLPQAAGRGHFNEETEKLLVQPSPTANDGKPRRLDALFWLGKPGEAAADALPAARRLTGNELARALISSAMNIRYHAPDRLARQMRFAESVAAVLPVHALDYPRSFAALDRVTTEIRRAVAA